MRLLMVSNKVKTYSQLYRNIIETLETLGHSVIWAADFSDFVADKSEIPCELEQIPINTNPLNSDNRRAYTRLLSIIDDYKVEGVLCSTPIGGTLARLAGKKKKLSPVLYEAHGFLFFKGAPLINRTVYKWHEKWLAHYTDALVTITDEDYQAAQFFRIRSGKKPYYVHGAGITVGVHVNVDKHCKRKELGLDDNDFVIISAGELNKNKNTKTIVKALGELKGKNIHYIACGVGSEKDNLVFLAKKLGVSEQFHLLGYRTDIVELMSISDVFVMPSFREGVPRSILEAMDLGLPCIGSNTRGIRDLIDVEDGGYLCDPKSPESFKNALIKLFENPSLRMKMGNYNREKAKQYSSYVVRNELKQIYTEVFGIGKRILHE